MVRIIFVLTALMVSYSVQTIAASPAMVEKHIFSPEVGGGPVPVRPGQAVPPSNPVAQKLSRELLFTGVIRSPHGSRVLILDKTKGASAEKKPLKEGDEIKGMTIKEIGNNYVLLAGQEKEVRLNLYSEGKDRPAPPPEPPPAEAAQPAAQPPAPGAGAAPAPVPGQPAAGQATGGVSTPPAAGQPAAPATPSPAQPTPAQAGTTKPQQAQTPVTSGSNPFLEAIKKAREQQQQGITPAPTGDTDSSAPNPFDALRRAMGN